ncbi:MAG: DUF951 domain-containing protein [Clostridia bacterium]|nr:DUF951 domain-containing protein [Clostridia bacterium]
MDYNLGDRVETKKAHPCGGKTWEIVRVGVDYKLKCESCGRLVMISAEDMKKIVKRKI